MCDSKNTSQNIKCLFGFHKYTTTIRNSINSGVLPGILICEHCRKVGYRKWHDGDEKWYDFDVKGICVHHKSSWGQERWFTGRGWVTEKPKNWKYEECLIK